MSTSKIATSRTSIQTRLQAVSGLFVYRQAIDKPEAPGAVVNFPRLVERDTQMKLGWRYEVPVLLFAQRADDITADVALEGYVDSVVNAFEAQPSCDGNIDSAAVIEVSGYKVVTIAGIDFLGVEVVLEVYA